MTTRSTLSKFAGLLMGTTAAKPAAEKTGDENCEKPTKRDDETDEEFEKRLKEWEDAQDDDGETAEADPKDTTDDNEDPEKLKHVRAQGVVEGVTAERNRWTAVLSAPEASGRVIAACTFLESTDMAPAAITAKLASMPVERASRSTLADRQAGKSTPAPQPGGGAEAGSDKDPAKMFAASVTAAAEKARGKAKAA